VRERETGVCVMDIIPQKTECFTTPRHEGKRKEKEREKKKKEKEREGRKKEEDGDKKGKK
jgi:hypothetical protein